MQRSSLSNLTFATSVLAAITLTNSANAQSWSNNYFLGGLNASVNAVVPGDGNTIFMAGAFTTANGVPVNRVAQFAGITWSPLGSGGPTSTVNAMARTAAGEIVTGEQGGAVRRFNTTTSTWSNLGAAFNGPISDLKVLANGDILAAGSFSSPVVGLARFSGGTWSALGSGLSAGSVVNGVDELPGGGIVAGGAFVPVGGGTTSLAVFQSGSWGAFNASPNPSGIVDALDVTANGELLAAYRLAPTLVSIHRADSTSWTAISATINSGVRTVVELPDGDVMIGGAFTAIGASSIDSIARFDGTNWNSLASSVSGSVNAISVSNDRRIVVAGDFTMIGGQVATRATVRTPILSGSVTQVFPSCIGMNGQVRRLFSGDMPMVGTRFESRATGFDVNATAGLEVLGLGLITPIPLNNLLPEGDPNCWFHIDQGIIILRTVSNGVVDATIDIPMDPVFIGGQLTQQVGAIEPGSPNFIVTATGALDLFIGRL